MDKKTNLFISLFFLLLAALIIAAYLYIGPRNISLDTAQTILKNIPLNNITAPQTADRKINYDLIKKYPATNANAITVSDANGDGKNELVYKNADLNILNSNWELITKCTVGESARGMDKVLVTDINGDGKKEIVTAGSLWDKRTERWGNYQLKVFDSDCKLLNDFYAGYDIGETVALMSEDIDGDNVDEIIAQVYIFGTKIYILDDGKLKKSSDPNLAKKMEINIAAKGFPDYVRDGNKVIIGLQTLEMNIDKLFMEDMNGDGKKETVVISEGTAASSGASSGNVMIYVYDADGELVWSYMNPTKIISAAMGDLDSDGYKEIFISGQDENSIKVLGQK